MFMRAQLTRRAIEHGIDVFMGIGRAETTRETDGLVDHHTPRHVRALREFMHADEQDCMLDGVEILRCAIGRASCRERVSVVV